MREALNLAARLGLMMLIAGLCLALTNYITQEPIAVREAEAGERLRTEVLEGAEGMTPVDVPDAPATLVAAYRADNGAGYVFEMSASGFGGPIGVTVGIRADGTIEGARVGMHAETPGLGAKAAEESFYGQYSGKEAVPQSFLKVVKSMPIGPDEIQAITAATITSDAITSVVNDAIGCYQRLAE